MTVVSTAVSPRNSARTTTAVTSAQHRGFIIRILRCKTERRCWMSDVYCAEQNELSSGPRAVNYSDLNEMGLFLVRGLLCCSVEWLKLIGGSEGRRPVGPTQSSHLPQHDYY